MNCHEVFCLLQQRRQHFGCKNHCIELDALELGVPREELFDLFEMDAPKVSVAARVGLDGCEHTIECDRKWQHLEQPITAEYLNEKHLQICLAI